MSQVAKCVGTLLFLALASACVQVEFFEPVCHEDGSRWIRVISVTFDRLKTTSEGVRGQMAVRVPSAWSGESTESQTLAGGPLIVEGTEVLWTSSPAVAAKAEMQAPAPPTFKWVGFETNELSATSPASLEFTQGIFFENMPGPAIESVVFFASDDSQAGGTIAAVPWTCRQETISIPTLSTVGAMALAGFLAVLGFFIIISRKKSGRNSL